VACRRAEDVMSVARPLLAVGFKEREGPVSGARQLERELLSGIALEAVFGPSTDLYRRLYEGGLIDGGFGAGYYGEGGCGLSRIGGETDRPAELAQEILAAVERARREGASAEACERHRRSRLGDYIREFNSPDNLGHLLGTLHFSGADLFAYGAMLAAVTPQAVNERLREHLDPAFAAQVSILPRDGGA